MDREALVDLGAITGNVASLCERVRGSQVMAVVKADGSGHGMVPAAWAAATAAYLHGLAARLAAAGGPGDSGEAPIGAHDVITALPAAIRSVS